MAFSLSSAGQYSVFDSSDLSIERKELFCIYRLKRFQADVVVQIYPKCLCIYGFVNKFLTGRILEKHRKVCGGSNLSTVSVLWGIYIKKCISLVRICLQTRNARNASTKFRKTSESKKAEKSLEISAFLVFSCLHLNQTLIMAGMAGFEPTDARVKVWCLTAWRHPNIFNLNIIPHQLSRVKSFLLFKFGFSQLAHLDGEFHSKCRQKTCFWGSPHIKSVL